MEDFRLTFIRLCKEHNIEPLECLVEKLKSIEHSGSRRNATLDLSAQILSPPICAVLGKVLTTDRHFSELRFADCMLSEDGIMHLTHGLTYNGHCIKLDLKGNKIRGAGVEALGKMLHHNCCLASICLEWNGLGMLDNCFAAFCDGLAANSCLRALDLRNNQIRHDSAEELTAALKRNNTLQAIDLRWNNIGILGGRAFVNLLAFNKTLSRLELAGNNVPDDILNTIDTAVNNNAERRSLSDEHSRRTKLLSKHIKLMEKEKSSQISEMINHIERKDEELRRSKRYSTLHVGHLQETLDERKSAVNSLAAKLSMMESELVLAEQRALDCSSANSRFKQEMANMSASHQTDIRSERQEKAEMEMKYVKEMSDIQDRFLQLQNKCDDTERKYRQQQEQVFELKEQVTHLQAEVKLRGCLFEERLSAEKQKQKEMQREIEASKLKEMTYIKQEAEEAERTLRERIQKIEANRLSLEEEVSRLKSTNLADKLSAEEQLQISKQQVKIEEDQRHRQLEERLRVLQVGKDELQSHSNRQTSLVSALQSKNTSVTLEAESLRRRLEEVGQELADKNNHTTAEVNKVRVELNQALNKLDSERSVHDERREQLSQADRQLSDQLLAHRQATEEKEQDLLGLREKLRAREMEIQRVRDEEAQRARVLQSAVMSYMSSAPPPRSSQ